ncbi:MFS transporter [Bacillus sp. CECT 9360]|uniref:CynX/NimT family MFS transporter n=1 Tax=Bacillus sp. CECT 9360 TaxID=2845821 RepID=UPI001E60A5A0|nr:MFS transporter [Bacillus sp. CECT 9360]CAH0343938.1 putative transporter YycB [Bacillus sp. CECT 9360]
MITKNKITHTHVSSNLTVSVLVLGIIFAAANLRAPLTSVGPIVDLIKTELNMSNASAGMLTTIPLLAFAAVSPLAPKFARRFGTEYTLFGAMIFLAAGIALRYVPSMETLFLGTALLGIAIAVCNVLLPGLVKREFPNKVGLMTGTYSLSMNLWAAIASGISIPISQGFGQGWRFSLVCWILLSLVSLVLWLPQLRSANMPTSSHEKGGSVWQSGLAWKVALFMGLQSTVFYTVITWFPSMLHEQGLSHSAAGWLLSLAQFVSLPASFLIPIWAGRLANQRRLVGFIVLCLLLTYAGLLSGNPTFAPLCAVLVGIALGAAFSLATMFFVLRTQNAHQAAELSGMAQSIGYLLAAIGPALFGLIHDFTHSWTIPIIILCVAAILLFIVGMEAGSSRYITISENRKKGI